MEGNEGHPISCVLGPFRTGRIPPAIPIGAAGVKRCVEDHLQLLRREKVSLVPASFFVGEAKPPCGIAVYDLPTNCLIEEGAEVPKVGIGIRGADPLDAAVRASKFSSFTERESRE